MFARARKINVNVGEKQSTHHPLPQSFDSEEEELFADVDLSNPIEELQYNDDDDQLLEETMNGDECDEEEIDTGYVPYISQFAGTSIDSSLYEAQRVFTLAEDAKLEPQLQCSSLHSSNHFIDTQYEEIELLLTQFPAPLQFTNAAKSLPDGGNDKPEKQSPLVNAETVVQQLPKTAQQEAQHLPEDCIIQPIPERQQHRSSELQTLRGQSPHGLPKPIFDKTPPKPPQLFQKPSIPGTSNPTTAHLVPLQTSPTVTHPNIPMEIPPPQPKFAPNISKPSWVEEAKDDPRFSLSYWGIPDSLITEYEKNGVTTLYPWQVSCLEEALSEGPQNLVYCAPTSGGKTLVAELLMARRVMETQKKALFVVPFISIAEEKTAYFTQLFSSLSLSVEGNYGPKYNQQTLPREGDPDIVVCTIEKANSIVNKRIQTGRLDELCVIVLDELHMLADRYRGYLIEILVTKILFRAIPDSVQIIGLSATLPRVSSVADWLNAKLFITNFRPVPLCEYYVHNNIVYNKHSAPVRELCSLKQKNESNSNQVLFHLARECMIEKNSVLVFCASRKRCEIIANELVTALERELAPSIDTTLWLVAELKRSPSGLDPQLHKLITRGICYHHAGLTVEERTLIENGFKRGALKILVATTTLAAGVNLPARRVVFDSRFYRNREIGQMDAIQYRQAAGRAGRAGQDIYGESIYICSSDIESAQIQKFMLQNLSNLDSALMDEQCMSRLLLESIVSGLISCSDDIEPIADRTLCIQQVEKSKVLDKILKEEMFLKSEDLFELRNGKYEATKLGLSVFEACTDVKHGLALYYEITLAQKKIVLDTDLHLLFILVLDVDDKLPTQNIVEIWTRRIQSIVAESPAYRVAEILRIDEGFFQWYMRAGMNAQKAARENIKKMKRFIHAMALNELIEEVQISRIEMNYAIDRGTLQKLQQSACTFSAIAAKMCHKLNWWNMEALFDRLSARLNFGCSMDIIPLVQIPGLKPIKARIIYDSGYRTVESIAFANVDEIASIIAKYMPFKSNKMKHLEQGVTTIDLNQATQIVASARTLLKQEEKLALIYANKNRENKTSPRRSPLKSPQSQQNKLQQLSHQKFISCTLPPLVKPLASQLAVNEKKNASPQSSELKVKIELVDGFSKSNSLPKMKEPSLISRNPKGTTSTVPIKSPSPIISIIKAPPRPNLVKRQLANEGKRAPLAPIAQNKLSSCSPNISCEKRPITGVIIHQDDQQMRPPTKKPRMTKASPHHPSSSTQNPPVAETTTNIKVTPPEQVEVSTVESLCDLIEKWSNMAVFSFEIHETQQLTVRPKSKHAPILKPADRKPQRRITSIAICFNDKLTTIPKPESIKYQDVLIQRAYYINMNTLPMEQVLPRIKFIFENPNTVKICFSSKTQLLILLEFGIQIKGRLMDPRLAAWLLNPEDAPDNREHTIEYITNVHCASMSVLSAYTSPQDLLIRRAAQSWILMYTLYDLLVSNRLIEPFEKVEMKIVPILAEMERVGIGFNTQVCPQFKELLTKKAEEIELLAAEHVGERFNMQSPQECDHILYDKLALPIPDVQKKALTKTGQRRNRPTNAEALEQIKHHHPLPTLIMQYRSIMKIRSSYIDSLTKYAVYDDKWMHMHRIYSKALQTTSATGRLAFADPSMQTLPHELEIEEPGKPGVVFSISVRASIIPRHLYVLVAADYGQIEFRLLAHFAEDENLMDFFKEEGDVFVKIATKMFHKCEADITTTDRTRAKETIYGMVYGMSVKTLAGRLNTDMFEAEHFVNSFKHSFPRVTEFLNAAPKSCGSKGYVSTIFGRRRYLQAIYSSKSEEKAKAERQAKNTICQGSAADLIKIAMIQISMELNKLNEQEKDSLHKTPAALMILQIHDELLFEVREDNLQTVAQLIKMCMESCITLKVPTPVKLRVGTNWNEMKSLDEWNKR